MGVAYIGGIFGDYTGHLPLRMQYHAHIILTGLNKATGKTIEDIDIDKWATAWRVKISRLSSKRSAQLKEGYDLTGWMRYILIENPRKAEEWRTVFYNSRLLFRLNTVKHYLKGLKGVIK